jgi:hypothetical protein
MISLFPAHPWSRTLGPNHTDNHQKKEAEAQGEQKEMDPRVDVPQNGLERRH